MVRVLLAMASCGVLLGTTAGWLGLSYVDSLINRVALDNLGDRPAEAPSGVENYLLVGTDSRAGTDGAYGEVDGQRSDTTILAHLAADGTTTLVSFPRDMLVTIPEYTDGDGTKHPAHEDKFNGAIAAGGPSLLVKLVENLVGIRIDHYVSMDLQGFKQVTDAIDGVEVCILPSDVKDRYQDDRGTWRSSTNTNDPMSGFKGGPGTIQVNGEQALAFVRQRHGLPDGDLGRIRRQQQFIGAMFRKIVDGGVLSDPIKLEQLVSTAASALTLDEGTSLADLRGLASRAPSVAAGGIRMESVPTHAPTRDEGAVDDYGNIMLGGVPASVQVYLTEDLERIVAPLGGHVNGGGVPGSDEADAAGGGNGGGLLAPSEVAVDVYNGSGRAGLASQVVADLADLGFEAANAGNASTSDVVTSRVVYGPDHAAAARTVQAAVPGARLVPDSSVRGVQLVLGTSFTEVVEPKPAVAPAEPAPSGGAPAAAAPTSPATPATPAPSLPPPTTPTCTY